MGLVYPILEFSIREDLRYRLQSSADRYVCLAAMQHFEDPGDRGSPDVTAKTAVTPRLPKIVGTLELSARKPLVWQPGDRRTYVSNLAVDRHCRRLGVARRLLAACESISLDWGISTLSLHVMADNAPARQLYHQAGYVVQPQSGGIGGLFSSSRRLLLHKEVV
ncbi:MAG: GNAT family N-acetyltransferase [Elainellaceae cyanobacterium]